MATLVRQEEVMPYAGSPADPADVTTAPGASVASGAARGNPRPFSPPPKGFQKKRASVASA